MDFFGRRATSMQKLNSRAKPLLHKDVTYLDTRKWSQMWTLYCDLID
jgi:hypothetical protein